MNDEKHNNASNLIKKQDAVDLIIKEVGTQPYDTPRLVKDRVKHRIAAAIKKGDLILKNNNFARGDFIAWARDKWSTKFFNHIANLKRNFHSTSSVNASVTMIVTHQDIYQCRDALNQALKKITELEAEIARLKPHAEKYLKNCATNKKNARSRQKNS